MTLYVGESLAVRNAVKRHGVVSQIGTQIHAGQNFRRVVEYVRSGKLGPISVVRTFNVMNQGPDGIGSAPDSDPPAGLDWEMWLGPGPKRRYNRLLAASSYHHCSFMAYSGGWTPGMAPHIIDLPYWALELDYPAATTCSGGRYIIKDAGDAPDVQEVLWQYPKMTMSWSMSLVNSFAYDFGRGQPARRLGIYFFGLNGTLYANYGMHKVVPEGKFLKDPTPPPKSIDPSPGHEREWLDCIKSGKQPSCSVFYHVKIDVAIALANLSMRLGRTVKFDAKKEWFADDPEAARLSVPTYREPWKFPAEYLETAS
jgi:predicted dehydrogenase